MKRLLALLVVVSVVAGFVVAEDEPQLLVRSHGSLTDDDDRLSGGRIVDWFDVMAPGDGQIVVTAVSLDFDPVVIFSEPSGRESEVDGGNATVRATYPVQLGDRLEVGVTAWFGGAVKSLWTGDPAYILDITYRPGIAGGFLTLFEEIEGSLDSSDEVSDRGGYIDWYDLDVPGGERVQVDLYSYDFDTYLIVELPDGTYLDNDDSDGSDSSISFSSSFGGIARVGATSFGHGEEGTYGVWVSTVDQRYIGIGDYITDYLESGEITYLVEGYPGDRIEVELSSDDFDTYVTVEDSSGNSASNDDYGDSTDSRLVFQIGDSGDATITVSSWDSYGGDFDLSVTLYVSNVEQLPEGYRLRDGDSIVGELSAALSVYDGAYYQLFTFAANRGERVEIVLESDDVDSFLRVVAPDGTEMTDDDGAGNYNSMLVYTADRGGIYEVYATSVGSEESGVYTISFRKLGESQIILNTDGELSRDDQQDITGKRYDLYSFQVTADRLVIIDVMSADFDSYAILRNSNGEVLLSDDDGGSESNSRIQYTPTRSETLELVVTSYSEGSTGRYSLTIYE